MKKLLFLGIGSALIFTLGGVGPAVADNGPHISGAQGINTPGVVIANVGADRCAACHRAHTAKAEYLLVEAQPALCYTCHAAGKDGAASDVRNGTGVNALGALGALRGGGFEQAAIASGAATKDMGALSGTRIATSNQKIPALALPAATTSNHKIDGTTGGVAWGNGLIGSGVGASVILECGSCHDPHGNKNYRILRPIPVDSGYSVVITPAVPAGTNPVTAAIPAVMSPGVTIPDVPAETVAAPRDYTTANYWLTGDAASPLNPTAPGGTVFTSTPKATDPVSDGYIQNIAAWCTTCHTRYLAGSGSYAAPNQGYARGDNTTVRTAGVNGTTGTIDPTFMYRHRSDANYKQGAANCITCHVSHGSNASVAGFNSAKVTLPDGTGGGSADSKLLRVDNRGTCLMCHNV